MDLLYHYCSGQALYAALESQQPAVWLSAMTQSNDAMEGKLVRETLQRMARKDHLTAPQLAWMLEASDEVGETIDCLAFCMSSHGDLLSQWRGYADDGAGFSIGFKPAYWHRVAEQQETMRRGYFVGVGKVMYQDDQHEKALSTAYNYMRHLIERQPAEWIEASSPETVRRLASLSEAPPENIQYGESLLDTLTETARDSLSSWFLLKSKAFAEESETRLWTLVTHPLHTMCRFRMRAREMVPYLALNIERDQSPIAEIVLGPKNPTPTRVVEAFLRNCGFEGVAVKRSSASYR